MNMSKSDWTQVGNYKHISCVIKKYVHFFVSNYRKKTGITTYFHLITLDFPHMLLSHNITCYALMLQFKKKSEVFLPTVIQNGLDFMTKKVLVLDSEYLHLKPESRYWSIEKEFSGKTCFHSFPLPGIFFSFLAAFFWFIAHAGGKRLQHI